MGASYYSNQASNGWTQPKRCYESHPVLKIIDKEGKELFIHGGSCTNTPPEGMDVLIAFDRGYVLVPQSMPWLPGEFVFFPITDMQAPKSVTQFRKLIEWTAEQMYAGKKVHAGCIGGHGRTGTFLAALVTHLSGEKDSINWVRENYCQKAVESAVQVDWLHKNFGIVKAQGTKVAKKAAKHPSMPPANYSKSPQGDERLSPMRVSHCIHGDRKAGVGNKVHKAKNL